MPKTQPVEESKEAILQRWAQAAATDWSKASAEQALDGLRLSHTVRSGLLLGEETWSEEFDSVRVAMAAQALKLGARLGEEPMHPHMKGHGSISSYLCHSDPSVYQDIMSLDGFTWASAACWSPAMAKAWSAMPGEEGAERFVAFLVSQGGKTSKEDQLERISQAPWDLSWWLAARPQELSLAQSGAALGAARLASTTAGESAEELKSRVAFAQSIFRMLQLEGSADLEPIMGKAQRDLAKTKEREELQEQRRRDRERSMEGWSNAVLAAFDADEETMLASLLPAMERRWPGSCTTLGKKSIDERSLFEHAVEERAKRCVQWLLDQPTAYPLGCSFEKKKALAPDYFQKVVAQTTYQDEDQPIWLSILARLETRALAEFAAKGCDLDAAEKAIEKACLGQWEHRSSHESKAEREAFSLAQTQRFARARQTLQGQEPAPVPSLPSPRL